MKADRKRSQTATAPINKYPSENSGGIRFAIVVALFLVWMCGIGFRLFDLQINQHESLDARATDQRRHEHHTKPLRGSILDRNGRELAVTLEAESLEVDPTELENPEQAALQLANLLGKNPKELIFSFNEGKINNRRSISLARELDQTTIDKIKNLGFSKGLIWRKDQKRFYPNETLAAQVLGFTNREDVGQAGIEAAQEKNLRGEYNEITEQRDGSGRVYELTESIRQRPRNIILTIDYAIQHKVEQALADGLAATKAKSGAAVVLDPATGEILAMVNAPNFNPNRPGDSKPEMWTNRVVQNFYEPGSTFKLVTYSATLEEKLATPLDQIDARQGFIKINNRIIKDSGSGSVLTLTQGFAKSSNVVAITLGQRLGNERLYEYIRRFGYGAPTGIELPVESRGMLLAPEKWTTDSIGSVPIGYEIGVTTLQSAAAFGAIANAGVLVAPHIIKEIREEDGKILSQLAPAERRVVSEATAHQMRQMLAAVTDTGGTAKRAQLVGYTSAGKTGTAHKYDAQMRRYSESKYIASFVGFAPVEKPAVVIAVMIDEPRGGAHHGGDAAAPIFRDIAEQILPVLHVAPDDLPAAQNENLVAQQPKSVESAKMPGETVATKINVQSANNRLPSSQPPGKVADQKKSLTKTPAINGKTPRENVLAIKPNKARERIVLAKKPIVNIDPVKNKAPAITKAKVNNSLKPNVKTKT